MTVTLLTIGTGINESSFDIVHNLDEFCFSIEKAFNAWKVSHTSLTAEMFCRYIRQRNTAFICMPLDEAIKVSTLIDSLK